MASCATINRNDFSMALVKIKYFNLREKLAGTIAIVSGVLVSLWIQCVLIVICVQQNHYAFNRSNMFVENVVIMYSQLTYSIIVICGIVGLCYGLKHRDKTFVYPWLATKVFETIVALVGTVLLALYGQFVGLMFPALLCLLTGFYLSICAWQTIKNMSGHLQHREEDSEHLQKVHGEKPPSYDNFTYQV